MTDAQREIKKLKLVLMNALDALEIAKCTINGVDHEDERKTIVRTMEEIYKVLG